MIDPASIKAGAQFVVTVERDGVDREGWVAILGEEGYRHFVRQIALSPLPAPSPTAEIDAEIVEAADVWRGVPGVPIAYDPAIKTITRLTGLIDRRRAMLKPKDAGLQFLLSAAEDAANICERDGSSGMARVLRTAAARVRKERGE